MNLKNRKRKIPTTKRCSSFKKYPLMWRVTKFFFYYYNFKLKSLIKVKFLSKNKSVFKRKLSSNNPSSLFPSQVKLQSLNKSFPARRRTAASKSSIDELKAELKDLDHKGKGKLSPPPSFE